MDQDELRELNRRAQNEINAKEVRKIPPRTTYVQVQGAGEVPECPTCGASIKDGCYCHLDHQENAGQLCKCGHGRAYHSAVPRNRNHRCCRVMIRGVSGCACAKFTPLVTAEQLPGDGYKLLSDGRHLDDYDQDVMDTIEDR